MSEHNFKQKLIQLNDARERAINAVNEYNKLSIELAGSDLLSIVKAELESNEISEEPNIEYSYNDNYDETPHYSYVLDGSGKINGRRIWFPSGMNC